jgi:hypothetical protein
MAVRAKMVRVLGDTSIYELPGEPAEGWKDHEVAYLHG